jgi:hypothetical protein
MLHLALSLSPARLSVGMGTDGEVPEIAFEKGDHGASGPPRDRMFQTLSLASRIIGHLVPNTGQVQKQAAFAFGDGRLSHVPAIALMFSV